jgi:TetR/AcrR family transcriptional regulator, tetracycline repressor protein
MSPLSNSIRISNTGSGTTSNNAPSATANTLDTRSDTASTNTTSTTNTTNTTDAPPLGRRGDLDRDEVIETALRLVETGGGDSLTMRKLAAELGVAPNSIYWHVGSRHDVTIALIERLAERQAEAKVTGNDSHERVMSAARHIWTAALAHPQVTTLAYSVGATSLLELPLERALAREITAAGLHGDAARDAMRAILICVGGFLVIALRPADLVPDPWASTSLWAEVDDPLIHPDTIDALTRTVDLPPLFERTVRAVVDSYIPSP